MTTNKPNKLFWVIAIVALLWNIMGTYQFMMATIMKTEMYTVMKPAEIAIFEALPTWHAIVFAIAVFAGVLGSILLLLKKKSAVAFFIISFLAIIIQMSFWLFGTEVLNVYSPLDAYLMPIIVILIAVLLVIYSRFAASKNWLK